MIRMRMSYYRSKSNAWLRLLRVSAVFLGVAANGTARADRISDETGDMAIIDATVEPANRGAYTNIHVRLENSGPKTVTLKSVETKLGERGAFDIHAGSGSMLHSDSFSLGSGEQVLFGDSRFRLMLGPLNRDLKEEDVVEVTFGFDTFAMTVPIHVHNDPAPKNRRGGGR